MLANLIKSVCLIPIHETTVMDLYHSYANATAICEPVFKLAHHRSIFKIDLSWVFKSLSAATASAANTKMNLYIIALPLPFVGRFFKF